MKRSLASLGQKMLVLGERDVKKALDLTECLEVNRKAFIALSDGSGFVPTRLGLPFPENPKEGKPSQDWTLIKPAARYEQSAAAPDVTMGLKVVSVRGNNPSQGLPLVPATIMLLDSATGVVQATMGATYLTVARTSAGPALAVQRFQPNLNHLVLFGAGAQAKCHIELITLAISRRIPRITIINRTVGNAEKLATEMAAYATEPIAAIGLGDNEAVKACLQTADVVSTTTNTALPLWEDDGSLLKKGCLITGIGSYTPDMQEVPTETVRRCHVLVDTPDAIHVGDLKHLDTSTHPVNLIGHMLNSETVCNFDDAVDKIFYKAVGSAIQDVLTAEVVVKRARDLGLGQEIDMS